jgi:hypothetical protein
MRKNRDSLPTFLYNFILQSSSKKIVFLAVISFYCGTPNNPKVPFWQSPIAGGLPYLLVGLEIVLTSYK